MLSVLLWIFIGVVFGSARQTGFEYSTKAPAQKASSGSYCALELEERSACSFGYSCYSLEANFTSTPFCRPWFFPKGCKDGIAGQDTMEMWLLQAEQSDSTILCRMWEALAERNGSHLRASRTRWAALATTWICSGYLAGTGMGRSAMGWTATHSSQAEARSITQWASSQKGRQRSRKRKSTGERRSKWGVSKVAAAIFTMVEAAGNSFGIEGSPNSIDRFCHATLSSTESRWSHTRIASIAFAAPASQRTDRLDGRSDESNCCRRSLITKRGHKDVPSAHWCTHQCTEAFAVCGRTVDTIPIRLEWLLGCCCEAMDESHRHLRGWREAVCSETPRSCRSTHSSANQAHGDPQQNHGNGQYSWRSRAARSAESPAGVHGIGSRSVHPGRNPHAGSQGEHATVCDELPGENGRMFAEAQTRGAYRCGSPRKQGWQDGPSLTPSLTVSSEASIGCHTGPCWKGPGIAKFRCLTWHPKVETIEEDGSLQSDVCTFLKEDDEFDILFPGKHWPWGSRPRHSVAGEEDFKSWQMAQWDALVLQCSLSSHSFEVEYDDTWQVWKPLVPQDHPECTELPTAGFDGFRFVDPYDDASPFPADGFARSYEARSDFHEEVPSVPMSDDRHSGSDAQEFSDSRPCFHTPNNYSADGNVAPLSTSAVLSSAIDAPNDNNDSISCMPTSETWFENAVPCMDDEDVVMLMQSNFTRGNIDVDEMRQQLQAAICNMQNSAASSSSEIPITIPPHVLQNLEQSAQGPGPLASALSRPLPPPMALLHLQQQWQFEGRTVDGSALELETWYVNHVQFPRCIRPRRVTLVGNPVLWTRRILERWRDHFVRAEPFQFFLVRPNPVGSEDNDPVVPHLIIQQQPDDGRSSILITGLVPSHSPGVSFTWATKLPRQASKIDVIEAAGALEMCQPLFDDRRCQVWHGMQSYRTGEIIDTPSGSGFTFLLHPFAATNSIPAPLGDENDLHWLMQRSLISGSQRSNLIAPSPATWRLQIQDRLDATGVCDDDSQSTWTTWYIDHDHAKHCFEPREWSLDSDVRHWEVQLRQLWYDMIDPSQPLNFAVVQDPVGQGQSFGTKDGHVILIQGDGDYVGILLHSPAVSSDLNRPITLAVSTFAHSTGQLLVQLIGMSRICEEIGCTLWHHPHRLQLASLNALHDGDVVQVNPVQRRLQDDITYLMQQPASLHEVDFDEDASRSGDDAPIPADLDDQSLDESVGQAVAEGSNHVVLYRLGHTPFAAMLGWGSFAQLIREIAPLYQLHTSQVLYVHELRVSIAGSLPGVTPLIVQSITDLPLGSDHVLILVDLEFHGMPSSSATWISPTWERRILAVPPHITRTGLLQQTRVDRYCATERDRCIVRHNHAVWNVQHVGFHPVSHGDYFRVILPSSDISPVDTECLVSSRQQAQPDPGMTEFEAQIHGIMPLRTPVHSVESQSEAADEPNVGDMHSFMQVRDRHIPRDEVPDTTYPQLRRDLRVHAQEFGHDPEANRNLRIAVWALDGSPHAEPYGRCPRMVHIQVDQEFWFEPMFAAWPELWVGSSSRWAAVARPQPWSIDQDTIAHVIIWNFSPGPRYPVLFEVYDSLVDGGQPRLHAALTTCRATPEELIYDAGLYDRCHGEGDTVECRLWWGNREMPPRVPIQIQSAHAFVITVQHYVYTSCSEPSDPQELVDPVAEARQEWIDAGQPLNAATAPDVDDVNLMQQPGGRHVAPHNHDTSVAAHQGPVATVFGLATDGDFPLTPGMTDHANLPFAIQMLYGQWQRVAVPAKDLSCRICEVVTWYVHGERKRICQESRTVVLNDYVDQWSEQLIALWEDEIEMASPVSIHVVRPRPPMLTDAQCAHVILSQSIFSSYTDQDVPVVVSVVDRRQYPPTVLHRAVVVDHRASPRQILDVDSAVAELISLPGTEVSVWADQRLLEPNAPSYARSGFDFVAFVDAARDGAQIDEVSSLQLPNSLQHSPRKSHQAGKPSPVQLCLFESLTWDERRFDPSCQMIEVCTRPGWKEWFQQPIEWPLGFIPDSLPLHAATWEALHEQYHGPTPEDAFIELYVDGASWNGHAGWSVVVVCQSSKGAQLWGCLAGTVQDCRDHPCWIGADCANNITAELSAFAFAQVLAFHFEQCCHVCIRPDLALSKQIACQQAFTHKSGHIAYVVSALHRLLGPQVTTSEVRGHVGNPWNELADQVAKWAARENATLGDVPWQILHSFALDEFDAKWTWMQGASKSHLQALPQLWQQSVLQIDPIPHQPLWPERVSALPTPSLRVEFAFVSANVLALESVRAPDAQRALRLDSQFHAKHFVIAGLQETRTPQGSRIIEHFQIYSSGGGGLSASQFLGCELWVHRFRPLCWLGDRAFTLKDFTVHVCHADDRRLLVHMHGPIQLLCVVLHAPCVSSRCSQEEYEIWWQNTVQLVRHSSNACHPVIMCDANAPLWDSGHPRCGAVGAEAHNPQGEILQDVLHQLDWYAPSTTDRHVGDSTTWSHPRGARLRRDYTFVGESIWPITVKSEVCYDVDCGFEHDDHAPVACYISGVLPGVVRQPGLQLDRAKMCDPCLREAFQDAVRTLPMPAWNVSVDQHNACFEQSIMQLAGQFFQRAGKPTKERPMLTPATLALIALKRAALKGLRTADAADQPFFAVQVRQLEKLVRPRVRADQRSWYDDWLSKLQNDHDRHDSKMVFQRLIRLGRRKKAPFTGPRPLPLMHHPDGTAAASVTDSHHILACQFRDIEAGEFVEPNDLVQKIAKDVCLNDVDVSLLPTPEDLWRIVCRSKNAKAAGPNRMVIELFKAGGLPMIHHLYPVVIKALLTGIEPVSWRGGLLFALYKGKGSPQEPTNYRSIFLSDIQAKIHHGWIRTKLEQLWDRTTTSIQFGGRKHRGTDVTHHLIQAIQAYARVRLCSTALLFLDLKAAFYSVQRAMLFEGADTDEALCRIMSHLGITGPEWQQIAQAVEHDHALQGLSGPIQQVVRNLFSGTYFTMPHMQSPVETHRGTRPGDPVGDILFNLAFTLVLADARAMFQQSFPDVQWVGDAQPHPCGDSLPKLPHRFFAEIAYVDDVVQVICLDSSAELRGCLQTMAACTHDAAAKRGLQVNYGKSKSEAFIVPRGHGARAARHELAHHCGMKVPVVTELGTFPLRVVPDYRHLGTHLQCDGTTSRDRRNRVASARSAAGQLHKPFFAKRHLALATKTQVFQSLVCSRHLFQVHTWCWVTERELQSWSTGLRHCVLAMARPLLKGLPQHMCTTDDLYAICQLSTPRDQLHAARLRFWKRLLESAPWMLWAALVEVQDPHGWIAQLRQSFQWINDFLPGGFQVGSSLEDWQASVRLTPHWNALVKRASHACRQYRYRAASWKIWNAAMTVQIEKFGALFSDSGPASSACFQCEWCDACFATRRALTLHTTKLHGYRRREQYYLRDDTCWACGAKYHTRQRALLHLRAVPRCMEIYAQCFPPMSEEDVETLTQADRIVASELKSQGWSSTKAFAPPLRVYGPCLPHDDTEAVDRMRTFWNARTAVPGTGFEHLHGRCLEFAEDEPAADRCHGGPLFVFQTTGGPCDGHAGVFRTDGMVSMAFELRLQTRLFVHFFSGYRRTGDLQWQFENHLIIGRAHVFCISVDLCLARAHSDLTSASSLAFWRRKVAEGHVLGFGGGPPCETWTAARFMPGGPPPVRSYEEPWGLRSLSRRAHEQVVIGTKLLQFLIELLLFGLPFGVCSFLEHPAFPEWLAPRSPPSIWATDIMHKINSLACACTVSFDQCLFGCSSKKPTSLLLVRLPELRASLLARGRGGRCNHSFKHRALQGREGDGFATARAKVYPPALNRCIAFGVQQFVERHSLMESEQLPAELLPLNSDHLVDSEVIQPDYYG